jgi:hypothetical protein
MAVFGEHNFGTPFGAVSPSAFFNSEGLGQYNYSGFSSRDGRLSYPAARNIGISSPDVATGKAGVQFYYAITNLGYGNVTYSASGMPSWMTLQGNVLSGTPSSTEETLVLVTASNEDFSDSKTVLVSIADSSSPQIASPLSATAVANWEFVFPINATGFPRTYRVSGLPDGLVVTGATISGIPTTAGSYNVTLEVWDEFGGYDTETLSLTVVSTQSNVIDTVVGTGIQGFSGDGGAPLSARLYHPSGVYYAAGDLYICDRVNDRIRKVSGGVINTVAGGGGSGTANGVAATSATLSAPRRVVVDSAGNYYISDTGNHLVRKVDFSTGLINTIAGSTQGFSGDLGLGTSAQLNSPVGLALSPDETVLYIVDVGNNRVRMLDLGSNIISTVIGNGSGVFNGDGISSTSAAINNPEDVCVDPDGNIYVSEHQGQRIRVSSSGVIGTVAGTGMSGNSGDGGPATDAKIRFPAGIVIKNGRLYIAEASNYIRTVDLVSGIINTVAGTGVAGFSGDGGPAAAAQLYDPKGLSTDDDGNLYIADSQNNVIRDIDPQPSPVALSVSPSDTPAIGGIVVTITGYNFSPTMLVSFGGPGWIEADYTYVDQNTITATVPGIPFFSRTGTSVALSLQLSTGEGFAMDAALTMPTPLSAADFSGNSGGFSSFCDAGGVAFLPWKPILTFPINYAVLKGIVEVDWQAPTPLDPCGDPSVFELQFTRTLSKDSGWRTVGPDIPEDRRTFLFDVSAIPYTTDGGLRIRAKNSKNLCSDYSQSFQAFTIANHAPNPVTLISPAPGDIVDSTISITWREAGIKDIDGHSVSYRIEATDFASGNTGWTVIPGATGIPEGTTTFLIDSTQFPEGTDYGIRVIATDELGADSVPSSSIGFSVSHSGQFIIDTLPPTGTILIDDGATLAKSQRVKLSLFAIDVGTGVKDVRFKNSDEDCWSDFDTFVSEKIWDLSSSDGVKRVLVQYRDYADNVSEACDCEIVSRVLCGAGNITDIEVFNGKLYAAFDRNGNLLEYRVLVNAAAALAEPVLSALARFKNSLYIASYDPDASTTRLYKYDGSPTLVLTLSGAKALSMVAYDGVLYIGMDDGRIVAYTGTASSTSYVAGSSVTRLRTDGAVLFATVKGGGQYLSFDGTTWKTNSL